MNKYPFIVCLSLPLLLLATVAAASEVFVEAEAFTSSGGWVVIDGPSAAQASGLALLGGAGGAKDGVATTTVSVKDAGHYRVWVRYTSHPKIRGPFHLTVSAGDRVLGEALFDDQPSGQGKRPVEVWKSFEVDLPEGNIALKLSKHENKNSPGSRQVDCVLLTMDEKLVPNHLNYGAQTFVRVTFGDGYEKPTYIHIFADHFHAPWYAHYALGKSGAVKSTVVKKTDMLKSGESTGWCNITPLIYQDSGAMLFMTARHSYTDYADRLRATIEFATAPSEKAIVRTLELDNKPGTVAVYVPPNLLTAENLALLKTDREIADATGKLADEHQWPTYGKAREKFPFFVTATIDNDFTPPDARVRAREQKTLDYFGFSEEHLRRISGLWYMKNDSYCQPDIDKMQSRAVDAAARFKSRGGDVKNIVFAEVMDEPSGQRLEAIAGDSAYRDAFRAWLKSKDLSPADLLVADWEAVKIVTGEQRAEFPALYYYSQLFRTRALGDFMAVQGKFLQQSYGGKFPVLANFSDGAIYAGNFFTQGVDYFELLDSPDQSAIWGEDWANAASTSQCASFNIELMRAAARERGQIIGQHLIAHAGRKAWDIKNKATSELARGVKILNNFCYGPTYATHEGGPYWRSHVWQAKPETWTANAALTREVGAVEDLLLTAMPAPAKVALLYSSSSDAWTVDGNLAQGFDRMHTWLALAHAQMPVDIISERQAAKGMLAGYSVCYLSGPNLTRAAAAQLKRWVQSGGTLWLTAGAASRDEFNRPLDLLDDLLPAQRGEAAELQKFHSSGRYLVALSAKDEVTWDGGTAQVLAVKQSLAARDGAAVLATFKDKSPALVRGAAGKGTIYCAGFLPALAYIKSALDARIALQNKVAQGGALTAAEEKQAAILQRTANPWSYPSSVRDLILTPARAAKIAPPILCEQPLVDAVFMSDEKGIVIPLANYTGEPVEHLALKVTVPRAIDSIESAHFGKIAFKEVSPLNVELSLPLENNDFLKLHFK